MNHSMYGSNGCYPTVAPCNININNMEQQYYQSYATTYVSPAAYTANCPLCPAPQYLQCS